MKYEKVKSSVDLPIILAFSTALIILLTAVLTVPQKELPAVLTVCAAVAGFLAWLYFGTWYELREDCLLCTSGPFREVIRYDRIRSLKPVKNLFSSMALGSKRIEIRQHGRGFITGTTYISPKDRDAFL